MGRIFNIPASLSFLDSLAKGLKANVENLESAIIFLPTRRSIFELQQSFLKLGLEKLPRVEALGDAEMEKFFLKNIPKLKGIGPAISRAERIVRLAKIVEAKDESKSLYQSIGIAKGLIALLDEVQNKNASLDELANIVAEEFAQHWQITLDFLELVTKDWADYKQQNEILEPIERRNQILNIAAEFYRENPAKDPIVIAGTTASIPATLDLVTAITDSENGFLVLRGADTSFADKEFRELPENHPQFNLKQLLGRLGKDLSQLEVFEETSQTAHEKLISTAMLPITKIEEWQNFTSSSAANEIDLIECEDAEEEANVIAFIVREAVEDGIADVSIVSNNNDLFKRVEAKLQVWNLSCNNSNSNDLGKTEVGRFLISLAEMCESQFSAIKFLSFFKQRLIPEELKEKTLEIELSHLRGLALEDFQPWQHGVEVEGLQQFAGALSQENISFERLFAEHLKLAANIIADEFLDEEFDGFIAQLQEIAPYIGNIDPLQYTNILRDFLTQNKVWDEYDDECKINLLSPIDARLLKSELTILADMNDGSFPNLRRSNEFLNQNMRATIGLDSPDKSIGQQAYDFELLSKHGRVVYTRALKSGGSPTQKSRFLESLTALVKLNDGEKYKRWVKQFYTPKKFSPCEQPRPCPPIEVRPKRLSVTKIGMLMRDPYSVYAEKILRLRKLDEIDKEIEPSDFGNFVHLAIEKYFENYDGELQTLLAVGKAELQKFESKIGVEIFWWPRFEKIAKWLIEQGEGAGKIEHEITGVYKIGDFEITAKADRVEISERIKIIDYKTGAVPKNEDVLLGLDPQLPLEAVIFSSIYKKPIESIEFWSVKGNPNEGEKIIPVFCDSFDDLTNAAKEGAEKLVKKFADANTPYIARPRPAYALKYNNYEHLARSKEWNS